MGRGMSAHLPTPRLVTIRHAEPGEDGGVVITCTCGTATRLVIEGLERLTQSRRLAFTCKCGRVRWYTAGPVAA